MLWKVVDDEEVLRVAFVQIDVVVYLIEIRACWTDNISVVVKLIKHIVTWIYKHLHLSCNFELKTNKVDILLLEKDHDDIWELPALEHMLLQYDSIQLILCPRLIVMDPQVHPAQNVIHLLLLLCKPNVLVGGRENVIGFLNVNRCILLEILLQIKLSWIACIIIDHLQDIVPGQLVIQKFSHFIIWFRIDKLVVFVFWASGVWCDQTPNYRDDTWAHTTFC